MTDRIDTARLRDLAEAATPGLWEWVRSAGGGSSWVEVPHTATICADTLRADAAFIAAANPSTLLDLLDELDDSVPKSWAGLMEILEDIYPEDIFPTRPDDPKRDAGPRIVSLVRELDATRDRAEGCHGKAGTHPCGCWADVDREPVCGHCNQRYRKR